MFIPHVCLFQQNSSTRSRLLDFLECQAMLKIRSEIFPSLEIVSEDKDAQFYFLSDKNLITVSRFADVAVRKYCNAHLLLRENDAGYIKVIEFAITIIFFKCAVF